jgi:drug/metabolite transporter (DMT)-like permease
MSQDKLLWIALAFAGLTMVFSYPRVKTAVIAECTFLSSISALICDYLIFGKTVRSFQAVGVLCVLLSGVGVALGWGRARRARASGATHRACA